jgi:hypothetical protein
VQGRQEKGPVSRGIIVPWDGYVQAVTRPSLRVSIANFRDYDASLLTKVRLVVANNLIKVRTKSNCCGHHGEPGC